MADHVDTVLDKILPVLREAVTAGLAKASALSSLVPVTRDDTPMPYRRLSRYTVNAVDGFPALRRLKADIDWAYEVFHSQRVAVPELEVPTDLLRANIIDFAVQAQAHERTAVFGLLTRPDTRLERLSTATLEAAVRDLGGTCRFVGTSGIANAGKTSGLLDDVTPYPGGAPLGTRGMVIRWDQGPVVRRLVDDLTLTWSRTQQPDEVELQLSERFFLDRPDRVRWFPPT